MKKLEAAIKDRAAKRWRERQTYYRVGSFMKGCANCGDTTIVELSSGGHVVRFTSGFQVFRAYDPAWVGWTWWCYECGAKDLACWAPDDLGMVEAQLGKPPIQGSFKAKSSARYALRKELMANVKAETPKVPTRSSEIEKLEKMLAALMARIKEEN
jgi:hypothetical protein